PILLLAEKLGDIIVPLDRRTTQIRHVAVVCPHCKTAQSYSTDKNSPDYDQKVMVVVPDQTVDPHFLGWLPCEVEACKPRLPLFATESIPTDDDKRRELLSAWKWGDVRCSQGHAVPKPESVHQS